MTIKLKNISTRNFNWINPGEVVNVEEKLKATYIHAGFKVIEKAKVEETNEVEKTKAELVKEAEALGLEFPKNIGKAKLQELIEVEKAKVEETNEENQD